MKPKKLKLKQIIESINEGWLDQTWNIDTENTHGISGQVNVYGETDSGYEESSPDDQFDGSAEELIQHLLSTLEKNGYSKLTTIGIETGGLKGSMKRDLKMACNKNGIKLEID